MGHTMRPKRSQGPLILGKPIAILVDGAFFFKRYRRCYGWGANHSPAVVAYNMYTMLMRHVANEELYRIFFYDSPPLAKKVHNPVSSRAIDFDKSEVAQFRRTFHLELAKKRKVALRLGSLSNPTNSWRLRPQRLKDLLSRKVTVDELTEDDVFYDIVQKGVDIKLGIDIAHLAYKRLVSRIVLVSGDSDFVAAAKLARREGIDIVLDPMWQRVSDSLFLHIDGMRSTCNNPDRSRLQAVES